jgi:hypothetical protein
LSVHHWAAGGALTAEPDGAIELRRDVIAATLDTAVTHRAKNDVISAEGDQ